MSWREVPNLAWMIILLPPFYVVNIGIYMFGGGGLCVGVFVCVHARGGGGGYMLACCHRV